MGRLRDASVGDDSVCEVAEALMEAVARRQEGVRREARRGVSRALEDLGQEEEPLRVVGRGLPELPVEAMDEAVLRGGGYTVFGWVVEGLSVMDRIMRGDQIVTASVITSG